MQIERVHLQFVILREGTVGLLVLVIYGDVLLGLVDLHRGNITMKNIE
jgi:hypothetical protein